MKITMTGVMATAFLALMPGAALAAVGECKGKIDQVRLIAQGVPSVQHAEKYLDEFNAKWETEVKITYLGENERRAKSRLDASTGAGAYHIYYIDEANVAEFASSNWIHPLAEALPAEYDIADFRVDLSNVAKYEGVQYFAPLFGGGDLMMYRADLLEAAGIEPPKTLDELVTAIKKVHSPDDKIYGWTARGQRGSGMNVWRWTPFFRAMGGEWLDDGNPAFNSEAGVKATELYAGLMDYAPPGVGTFTWSDSVEAFRSGQVVFAIESAVLGLWMEDEEKSVVAGKIGYAPPPDPLPSAGYAHGLAVSKVAANDGCEKLVASDLVGWMTSKEMEARRVADGITSDIGRQSTLNSEGYLAGVPKQYVSAIEEAGPKTNLLIMASPSWPEIGDNLGLVLEEVFTGGRSDIAGALDEAAFNAEDVLRRADRN